MSPEETADEVLIKKQGLHYRRPEVLASMLESHRAQLVKVEAWAVKKVDADWQAGRRYGLMHTNPPLSRGDAASLVLQEGNAALDKLAAMREAVRLLELETALRASNKVQRSSQYQLGDS